MNIYFGSEQVEDDTEGFAPPEHTEHTFHGVVRLSPDFNDVIIEDPNGRMVPIYKYHVEPLILALKVAQDLLAKHAGLLATQEDINAQLDSMVGNYGGIITTTITG